MAIMEQNKMLEAPPESGSKPPSTTPAYFVILHQAQGDEKEERILVANRDASAVAPVVQRGPHESKSATFLSADCISGGITVSLDNNNMWNEFYRCSTEMVLTKQGRRMFPYCRYWISGMDPYQKYILAMDITPLDTHKYKWNGKWWESGGKAEPHVLGRAFIHPESPSTGQYWMHQPVSFYKLKLTNNLLDQEGHIILHSMHRYLPRLHVIPADKATEVIQLNGPDVHTFTFPQTEFFAVTAYQNLQITQLKIDCNPFAKGFREGTVVGRPPKEGRPKNLAQEKDSPGSKKLENNNQESTGRLKDSFSMSEQSDAETENESLNAKQELLSLSNSQTTVLEQLLQKLNKLDSLGDARVVATPSVPADPPKIKIKEEPEDNYDYNKTECNTGVQVKQEHTDDEVTDNYSNSDDDYPILERHFAQFSTKLRSDRRHSVRRPSGVAKAKLLKLDDGKMPTLYLESCSTKKTAKNVLTNNTMRSIKQEEFSNDSPSIISCKREEFTRTDDKRPIKRKIYADYAVPVNVRSNRGRKKKPPSVPAKPKAAITPGSASGAAPVAKRRGRPPKNKGAKVGRPPKKKPPIETPQVPDFKPDLEDVDGVLFVAFSSKEALEVHTVGKPKADTPLAPPDPPVHVELTEEQKKIVNLERQLLVQLKAMRHRQVIHPALQQVGLRLNIVDHSMSIDLRYLGVELPLPFITSDSRWDNCGLSSEGLPFVSRTGKTTDFTKIKGWRDKFSTNPAVKTEAGSTEATLKNRSAFCSDELDEYLENEAKLMADMRGTSQNETFISTVSFQFPTKSASYVRTLDSVLKKQALQASSNSIKISKPPSPEPVKKRKYTRRGSTPKKKLKTKPVSPAPVVEKPVKSHSPKKPKSPKRLKFTPLPCVKSPTTSQPGETPRLSEHDVSVQPSVLSPGKDSLWSGLHHTPFQSPPFTHRSTGLSKVHMKLLELEESAICQGKPRTYVTEERAEIALSALLTMQGFLKSKPLHKTISKQTLPCNNEFCHLGCICTSLNRAEHKPAHCQQEACMFGCDSVNSKLCLEKDGLNITPTSSKPNADEDMNSSTEDKPDATTHGTQPAKHADQTDEDRKSHEEIEKPCISVQELPGGESNNEGIKTPRRNSGDSAGSCSKRRSPKVVPIWDRADVENNSEPVSILEKGEVIEGKIPFQRRQSERVKSSASQSSHLYTPKPAVPPDDSDLEDLHHHTSMTCARARVYKRKSTQEKAKKDHGACSETPGKENSHKPSKYREREKENAGNSEVSEKRHKKTDSSSPNKLFNIISDCSWEQDSNKILNIVSQHVDNKEPQSFKVGGFNIELTSENKGGGTSKSSATSHVKITMAPDQNTDQVSAQPSPVKENMASIKPPEKIPLETRAEKEAKSHGGKGLPFYTKVIPAGKLVAQLKNSTLNQSELIQVNGKKFPQAKLLLGQMGALHPANRIAAYITYRLRPSLLYMSKAKKDRAKVNVHNADQESSTANENLEIATDEAKTAVPLPQSETVTSPSSVSTPRATLTSGLDKRLGPRLLLIPVANSSAPFRPIQCVQTGPGKKVVLQPLKGPNGVNLFRHPSGQIIQLVPLQQLQTANAQQSQRVVIRSPGPALGIQLPLKTTTDAAIPTLSVPPAPALQTVSLSKISPVKSGVTVIPTSPSQIATLRIRTPPRVSSEVSPSTPKVVAYAGSGCGLITSTGVPLQSGGVPVLTYSTSTALSSSPQDSAAKPKVILMSNKPAVMVDANNLTNVSFLKSAMIISSSEENVDSDNGKECKGLSSLEADNSVEKQNGLKESVASAEQEVFTPSIEKIGEAEKKMAIPSSVVVNLNESEKTDISSRTLLQGTNNQDSSNSSQKSSDISTDIEAGHLLHTTTVNPAAESNQNVDNPVADSDQDPKNPAAESAQEPENSVAQSGQHLENVTESDQDPANPEAEIDRDPENAAAEIDRDPKYQAAENDQDPIYQAAENDQDPIYQAAENDQDPIYQTAENDQDPIYQAAENDQDPIYQAAENDQDPIYQAAENDQDPIYQAAENDQGPENPAAKGNCILLEQDGEHTVESACSTAQVQLVTDSEGNAQSPLSKSEKKEGEKGRRGRLLTDFTTMNTKDENLPLDPGYNSSARESEQNSEDEDESEAEESVDIETVEELSEKNNLAQLKAKATTNTSHNDKCSALVNSSKGRKKGSKVNGDDNSSIVGETVIHRRNHTANERKRRNEMRDLFEELKRALSLHNLPKVSKSHMLKKAIEEIEGLTDTADSLMKQKTLMSQKQSQLIKKVSNLSGKPKEVVLKKLEYLYAKQNALEAENKKYFEEDQALKASVNKPLPLKLENEANESSSSKSKKPIILSRTPVLLSAETQETVVVTSPNLLKASTGQLEAVNEVKVEESSGISPTHVQADVRLTDDLSMMPKIISVTSLAEEASSDLGQEFVHTPIKDETDTEVQPLLANTAVCHQAEKELPCAENLPSTSHVLDTTEEHSSSMNITQSSASSLPENLPLASASFVNAKASSKSGKSTMNDLSLDNVAEDVRDSELELELNKLSSVIDEAELEPSELSDVMEDHEDSDETLTSLLNEIALLNQQLNNDNSDLGCNFPGSDTPSQGSVDKSAGGDSSPFFFGRFKELPEPKENVSLSPLFLQLDEGEIQESVKHNEEPGIVFEDVASKAAMTEVEDDLLQSTANVTFLQASDKPEVASSPNMFWRPMPKLAPLGLKSSNVPSDQRVLGNKSMPSLASAAIRLSSPNHMD